MRTFVIFPAHVGKEIEASSQEVAIRKYRKTNPIEAGNLIYATNKVNLHSELQAIEQGVIITETPKPIEIKKCADYPDPDACDPEV